MLGMKPKNDSRSTIAAQYTLLLACLLVGTTGCSIWRGEPDEPSNEERLKELMRMPEPPDLVREAAVPRGMRPIAVLGVGVVNALDGTGGPADPSPLRDQLIEEMKHNNVRDPNQILELEDTALVRVRAMIPPGARRGDSLDLQVVSPERSRVSDLHGGWLLDTRMRHQQVLESSVRQSDVLAMGMGPIITRTDHESGSDDALKIEGRILDGGRVQSDRNLGLILRPQYQHVKMSARIAEAINRRFFFFDGKSRRGIAKAVEDDYIEVEIHPRYRDNPYRMMSVVMALSATPDSSKLQHRLTDLSARLADPSTSSDAALQLEGIGDDAIPTLLAGIQATNPELRFYAAETLAYLDRPEAIEPLENAARTVPAFRHPALLALSGIPKPAALESLMRLFEESSLETRFGAFVAARDRRDGAARLSGESLGDALTQYRLPSQATPAIVLSLREKPEVVLFGSVRPIQIDGFLFGSGGLILKPEPSNSSKVRISRFRAGQDDQRVVVDNSVASVVEGYRTRWGRVRRCDPRAERRQGKGFHPRPTGA